MSETTYYPLTEPQKLVLFAMKFCLRKETVNISTEVVIHEELDRRLIYQAMMISSVRIPSSTVRLHRNDNKEIVQYFSDEIPNRIPYIDFTGKTEQEYEDCLNKWSRTPFPNKLMDTQLYALKLLKKPNGELALFGCFAHIVFDAYSVMMVYRDIFNVYFALRDGKPFPPTMPSPIAAYEADYRYRESEQYEIDKKFFDEVVFADEPHYTSPCGCEAKQFLKDKNFGVYPYSPAMPGESLDLPIDKQLNDAVVSYALKNKMSPQAPYLLAVRSYLSAVSKRNDVMITNNVARRATIIQKRAGGTMVNALPIRTDFGDDISFEEGCQIVYLKQCDIYRHSNFFANDWLDNLEKKFGCPSGRTYQSVGLTYQPFFAIDQAIDISYRRLSNGTESQLLYMSIMPRDSKGNMVINYSFMAKRVLPDDVRKMHEYVVKFLQIGLQKPETVIKEINHAVL